MKQLFDKLSAQISKRVTRTYSTSFSLGIYFIHKDLRDAIYAIYGFVRVADEIVDSFEGYDQEYLLTEFQQAAHDAIESGISTNPVLNSFQQAVYEYDISSHLIEAFFQSMKMDLQEVDCTSEEYKKYIYGSAEVVGLMCLHVFTEGNKEVYDELKPYARKLGMAFQKVNFLRDLRHDYHVFGRVYFPRVDISRFSEEAKIQIEDDSEEDFKEALIGIKKLPASSKGGVYLAYLTYRSLFNKIKKMPAQQILSKRVRINNGRKFGIMLNSLVQQKLKLI